MALSTASTSVEFRKGSKGDNPFEPRSKLGSPSSVLGQSVARYLAPQRFSGLEIDFAWVK
jgi:hypothetical protein